MLLLQVQNFCEIELHVVEVVGSPHFESDVFDFGLVDKFLCKVAWGSVFSAGCNAKVLVLVD